MKFGRIKQYKFKNAARETQKLVFLKHEPAVKFNRFFLKPHKH